MRDPAIPIIIIGCCLIFIGFNIYKLCTYKPAEPDFFPISYNNPIPEIKPFNDTVEAMVFTVNKNKKPYWRNVYIARHYDWTYHITNVLDMKKRPIIINFYEIKYRKR